MKSHEQCTTQTGIFTTIVLSMPLNWLSPSPTTGRADSLCHEQPLRSRPTETGPLGEETSALHAQMALVWNSAPCVAPSVRCGAFVEIGGLDQDLRIRNQLYDVQDTLQYDHIYTGQFLHRCPTDLHLLELLVCNFAF